MTINEMFDELENKVRDTYIVTLKYKYEFEEKYTIENQILVYDSKADSYVWQNDWNEGQTDVEVLGYMLLGDVDTTKVEPCEDCVSREALKERFRWLEKATKYGNKDAEQQHFSYSTMMMYEIKDEIDNVIDSLPSVQPESLEQIKWERDTAIEQLKQLGYGLGEKVEPCEDCVSRKELLSRIDAERRHLLDIGMDGAEHIIVHHARRIIEDMPSVTPQPYNAESE